MLYCEVNLTSEICIHIFNVPNCGVVGVHGIESGTLSNVQLIFVDFSTTTGFYLLSIEMIE